MTWSRRSTLIGLGTLPALGCRAAHESPPATSPRIDVRLPPVVGQQFPNGALVYVTEDRGLPLVAIAVAIRAGFGDEPMGKEGLATLASELLLQGFGGGDEADLLARYGDLGTRTSSGATAWMLYLRCTVHRDDAPAAVQLLVDNLRSPTLAQDSFELLRRQQLDEVAAAKGQPELVASLGLTLGTFGVDPPITALGVGTRRSLAALDVPAVQAWLRTHTQPSRLAFGFAGATDLDEASGWVAAAAADWAEQPSSTSLNWTDPIPGPQTVLVEWPKLGRPLVALGVPGRHYSDPDEFAHAMADSIVGGMFHTEFRDRQRISYGLRSETLTTRFGPLSTRWTTLEASKLGSVLTRIRELLSQLRDDSARTELVARRALEEMRRAYYVELMTRFHGPDASVMQLLRLAEFGLPPSTPTIRFNALVNLDARKIASVLRTVYDPDNLRVCVVADPADLVHARRAIRDPYALTCTSHALTGTEGEPPPPAPPSPDPASPAAPATSPPPATPPTPSPTDPPAPQKPAPQKPAPQQPTPQQPNPQQPTPPVQKPGSA